jgi:hypothetical protein
MDIVESQPELSSSIFSKFKTVKSKDFLGDPFHPNEIKSPLNEGEFAIVPLILNTDGNKDADIGFLGMLVKDVNNIACCVFYPQRIGGGPSKEARLGVSEDIDTIKAFPPGTRLEDVMSDKYMLAKIGLNTPYWVEILGNDGKPDRRHLVFRRKWGKQDLLVAINGEDSGIIKNVDKLTKVNDFGKERIIIKNENGEERMVRYDELFREAGSSLDVALYCIPSDKA